MAAYEYEALDPRGRTRRGVMTGDGPRQVRQQLREQGLTPVALQPVREEAAAGGRRRRGRLSSADLAVVTRQFATLVASGLTVEEALRALVAQSEGARLRRILSGVRALVMEGASLTEAIGAYPEAFPGIYRASVMAGEQSGRLGEVLERLAAYIEAREVLRQRVGLALVYPVILVVVAFAIVMFLFAYVMPKVIRVFEDTGQALPLLTRVFVALTDAVQQYGLWAALALALGGAGLAAWLRLPGPRLRFHALLLRLPGIRRLSRGLNTARMARTLAIMVGSGVPLLNAMQAAGEVLGNLVLRRALEAAAMEVREGVSLHRALARSGQFPPILVQMVASGEASGQLGEMLEKAAVTHEREMEARVGVLVGLFEPMMILLMGAIVLLIVLAILLPIFDINQLIR